MKIFSAEQIRQWDQYTISNEPVASSALLERAAAACCGWIIANCDLSKTFMIFCGNGNNGGDGLAIARILYEKGLAIQVYILESGKRSSDCEINLKRLEKLPVKVIEIATEKDLPEINSAVILIEAIYGTGLNRPLDGITKKIVEHINSSNVEIISIDMPAGLFADIISQQTTVKATHTLSFQTFKLAFMLAESEPFTGNIHLLDIGLHPGFYHTAPAKLNVIDKELIHSVYRPRKKFTHKYSYGHALLFAGSTNMMGAAILCAKACLRSGAGLVTVHSGGAAAILQTALPEALTIAENDFAAISKKKSAIGTGPGLELNEANESMLKKILVEWNKPLVIDAASLNMLGEHIHELSQRSDHPAVLTPHSGEFERLFGKTNNDLERIHLAIKKAAQHNCYIILKGHHSLLACPDGSGYFNMTGNSGMATAGSGDVLTGIITGLLAQGYPQKEACLLGVYLHGIAGDFAAVKFSEEAMMAGDITEQLGAAFKITG